jgi:hypothetical protein
MYQLRTYWAAPDKHEDLHARFRTLTLRLFARHAMQVIGFWTPAPATPDSGDLVYRLAFPDQAALETAWQAFRADLERQAGKATSEPEGPLVARLTSTILNPTDYSPLT